MMPSSGSPLLWRTIRLDLRLLCADRAVVTGIVVFALLLGYGVRRGGQWVQHREQQRLSVLQAADAAVAAARQQVVDVASGQIRAEEAPFAGWVFEVRRPATLPTAPAAALSIGQADVYPFSTSLDLYTIKNALFKNYETESPGSLLAGRFDTAFVLIYCFPLIICALGYNLLSQEREDGTLGLLLSQSVTLASIAFSKMVARGGLLLLLTAAVTLTVLRVTNGIHSWRAAAPALTAWLLLTTAYVLFWAAVVIRVNASGRSSTYNAVALLGIWLGTTVIAPACLSVTLAGIEPAPSRLLLLAAQRRLENEAAQLGQAAMAEYHPDHPELLPHGPRNWNDIQSRFIYTAAAQERRVFPLMDDYQARLDEQQRLVDRVRFLSPAVLLLESFNALAGTDRMRAREFTRQVERFVDRWRLYAVPRSFRQERMTPADYDSLITFTYVEPSRRRAYTNAATSTAALLVATVMLAWSAITAMHANRFTQ